MPSGPVDVVVVLVAHDGAGWLPRTLAALQASTTRPAAVVGVDTGSRDASPHLLAAACDAVVPLPRGAGYPAAVRAGLAAAPPSRWLWLLHDDSAPAPDALQALLAHADADPSAVLLGPKAVSWDDPRRVVEAGLTVDGDGVLVRVLEPGEPDQGQHDAVRDVLAVGTAGALVRRDVWDAVGGLDPALPLGRDDVDLGWRVNGFGGRVVVVPAAVVQHARALAVGLREPDALDGRRLAAVDRQQAVRLRLAFAPVLPLAVLGVLVTGLLRALLLLLSRCPGDAADELRALAVRPGPARSTRAGARRVPARSLRPLVARRRTRVLETLTGLGARLPQRSPVPLRQRPGLLLGLGLLVVAVLAERSLLPGTGPVLAGGRLLPAPPGATDLWDAYGRTGAPPVLALLAVLAGPLLGSARAAVDVVVLLSVPLAALSAYGCAAPLVRGRALRAWAAATWALLPVATGAVAAGRLDTALGQVLLPPLLLLGVRLLARDRAPDGGRLAARTGLLLAVLVAATPLLWPLAAVLLLAGALGGRLDDVPVGPRLRPVGLALAVPLLVLLPWSASLLRSPGQVLRGPWPAGADLAEPVGGLGLALLHPGGPGLPAQALTAGLVLAALAGTSRRGRRRRTAVLGWLTTLASLAAAGVLVRLSVDGARVWPGPALQLAAAGLLVAAVVGGEGLRGRLQREAFGARQLLAGGVAVLAAVTPVLLGAGWVVRGADGPLRRDAAPALPAFARAELAEQPGVRALVLQAAPGRPLRYAVVGGQGARLGDAPDASRLGGVVADLASGRGGVPALSTRAVRYVAVRGSSPALVATLDGQAGLVRRGQGSLWQVSAPTSLLLVLPPAAAAAARLGDPGPDPDLLRTSPPVPVGRSLGPGPAGRLLVLARPAGRGWTATLAGRPLRGVPAWGWAQAFVLPPTGGRVVVRHDEGHRGLLLAGQALLLVGAAVVAGPGGRP